ncbi:MAG: bifunctional methylenetetrahydrofolate dehydrogenase/methenyltetrahydrofolate cyclohydrolase FolD [Candidatus Aminicenantia bacterium]
MGEWLEGKTLAEKIKQEIREEVSYYHKKINQVPGLVGILVGENQASKVYLRTKERNCQKTGIFSEIYFLPETIPISTLIEKIDDLNRRNEIDGILVQLPLPSSFNQYQIINAISPEKDVDGFHPYNLGNLLLNQPGLKPCTPLGIIELLKSKGIKLQGQRAVVIGRSLIVGKPLAGMLVNENATVTICHSKTKELPLVASEADILVAAIGRGAFITPEFVKPGAVVIDVGMNQLTDINRLKELFGTNKQREEQIKEKGYTLIGDVHPEVISKAAYLTPVPGGVGPLTVAMLLKSTLFAFKKRKGLID